MMRAVRSLFAAFSSLSLAFLFIAPVKAAPLTGAFAPAVEDNVVSIARRCWYRPSGRLVCAHRARPYYAPYRYSYRRSYYYPRYYARPYVYRSYSYYSYYSYYAQPYYGPTYAPAPYYTEPYYYRPYYQNQFYLEYNRPYRIYEGPVYFNPW